MSDALSASIFIGEAVSAGLSGSILFVDVNGKAAQSTSLNWDNVNAICTIGGVPTTNIAPLQVTSAFPAGQTCTASFGVGSTGISFNMNNPGVLFNAYFDGTSFRSMATGYTGIWRMNASTGLMRWATGPTVVGSGTVSAQTDQFSITNAGLVGIGTNNQSTRLWIGDGTVSTSNVVSFGKYETATESNQPLIQMKSVIAAGASQDLALAAQSTSGGIVFYTGLPTTPYTIGAGSSAIRGFINASGNWAIGATGSFGSGTGVVFIANAGANPSANPTGGGILYVNAGALTYRGSSGTITVLGPA